MGIPGNSFSITAILGLSMQLFFVISDKELWYQYAAINKFKNPHFYNRFISLLVTIVHR